MPNEDSQPATHLFYHDLVKNLSQENRLLLGAGSQYGVYLVHNQNIYELFKHECTDRYLLECYPARIQKDKTEEQFSYRGRLTYSHILIRDDTQFTMLEGRWKTIPLHPDLEAKKIHLIAWKKTLSSALEKDAILTTHRIVQSIKENATSAQTNRRTLLETVANYGVAQNQVNHITERVTNQLLRNPTTRRTPTTNSLSFSTESIITASEGSPTQPGTPEPQGGPVIRDLAADTAEYIVQNLGSIRRTRFDESAGIEEEISSHQTSNHSPTESGNTTPTPQSITPRAPTPIPPLNQRHAARILDEMLNNSPSNHGRHPPTNHFSSHGV